MPSPTGTVAYSYGQLEGYWNAAGGPPRLAPVAAAIALAESRGKPNEVNPTDNGGKQSSYGLWQISNGTHSPPNPNWADPLENARLAVAKWQAGGWKPWGTWASGEYRQFLQKGVAPVPPHGDTGGQAGIPYKNPFRGVKNLRPERIDMGVDYAGTGPVYALGPGVITASGLNPGWGPPHGAAPGGWIGERITAGPLAGRFVYVAEGIQPQVKVGQRVTADTVIGTMVPSATGIETGLAAPGGQGDTLASSLGQYTADGTPTAAGVAYANLLAATGTPRGVGPKTGGSGATSAPGWLQRLLNTDWGIIKGIGGAGKDIAGLGGISTAIDNLTGAISGVTTVIDWLVNPGHWVRIGCGVGGSVLLFAGLASLTHVGGIDVPVAGHVPMPAQLPIGILEVGAGGVLLFLAFHNLPESVTNVSTLTGYLREQSQSQAKAAA